MIGSTSHNQPASALMAALSMLLAFCGLALSAEPVSPDAPAAPHPQLRNGNYLFTAQLHWQQIEGESEPDFANAPLTVLLNTYRPGDDATALPLRSAKLDVTINARGEMEIDLPQSLLSGSRQSLEITLTDKPGFGYCGSLETLIDRRNIEQIKLPLEVKVRPAHFCKVTFKAVNERTGRSVPDVKFVLRRTVAPNPSSVPESEIATDAEGNATIELSDGSPYVCSSSISTNLGGFAQFTVRPEQLAGPTQTITLPIPAEQITGRILLEKQPGQFEPFIAPPGSLWATGYKDHDSWSVYTEPQNGAFTIYTKLRPGHYVFHLPIANPYNGYYIAGGRTLDVDEHTSFPREQNLVIQSRQPASLTVEVTDQATGQPIPGVKVNVLDADTGQTAASGQCDEHGQVALSSLRTGWYRINVLSEDHQSQFAPSSFDGMFLEGRMTKKFQLTAYCSMQVSVIDAEGHPVPDVTALILCDAEYKSEHGSHADANGKATIGKLLPGGACVLVISREKLGRMPMDVIRYTGRTTVQGDGAITVKVGQTVNVTGHIADLPGKLPRAGLYFMTRRDGHCIPGGRAGLRESDFESSLLPDTYEVYMMIVDRQTHSSSLLLLGDITVPLSGAGESEPMEYQLQYRPDAKSTTLEALMSPEKAE